MSKQPQFSAKFKAGMKYLRHKNGIVYPFNPQLEKDPNYTVVTFKSDVRIVDKPLGYIPPPPEEKSVVAEDTSPKIPETMQPPPDEIASSSENSAIDPTGLVDSMLRAAPNSDVGAQLASGLDIGD